MPAKFVTCQLCGQGFGSASISIHIPQCYDKALKRWQLDPRGPKPILPSRFAGGGGGGSLPGSAAARGGMGQQQPTPLRSTLHQQVHQGPGMGGGTRQVGGGGAFAVPEQAGSMMLSKCRKCGRGFSYDRVQYHESVCVGAASRKQFNSKKQRLSNFDKFELRGPGGGGGGGRGGATLRGGGGGGGGGGRPIGGGRGGGGWRQQHQEFQAAIKAARQYSKATAANRQPQRGAPPPRQARQPFAANALRTPEMFRAKQAVGRGGGGGRSGPFPSLPQQPESAGRRPQMPSNQHSRAFGGGGDRFAAAPGGGGGGGGGNYRILNTNQTSAGMMQAMGRM